MNEKINDMKYIQLGLSEPFPDDAIRWKPEVTKKKSGEPIVNNNGERVAGCTAHIDARDVMNRLDSVVGWQNWNDEYLVVGSKNVECRLTVMGITKIDVGQIPTDGGFADPLKSAYSDALKRAAVKFGIGRHLYEMEMKWLPFDGFRIITATQTATQTAPTNKNGSAKLMSAESFVKYCRDKLGYTSLNAVRETLKTMGVDRIPSDSNGRKRAFDALDIYQTTIADGGSIESALTAVADQIASYDYDDPGFNSESIDGDPEPNDGETAPLFPDDPGVDHYDGG